MILRLALLVVVSSVAACAGLAPERTAPPARLYEAAEIPGLPGARFWGDGADPETQARVAEQLRKDLLRDCGGRREDEEPCSLDVLALSGGGPDGAYGAGLLTGWTDGGGRPEFELVTGVSVGALIAPFAFAGPEYDPALRAMFTTVDTEDVADLELIEALRGALGVASAGPLRRRVRALVDAPLLGRIAEAHRAGRRLLIGTTNLDAGRPVVWDMGAIAAAGRIELFREVMLASAAVPAIFPPVGIEVAAGGRRWTELHVDGGVARSVILGAAAAAGALPLDVPFPVESTVYVIQNNALAPRYEPVDEAITAVASRALSALIRAQSDGDIRRIYAAAQEAGARFRLAYVPPRFSRGSAIGFDPVHMTRLYDAAHEDAENGIDWLTRPPGVSEQAEDEEGRGRRLARTARPVGGR